jgi:hypothetical protein
MALITMTREIATLGKDVAAGLAERLGLEVVHHELVEHGIAERAGLRESAVHHFLEGEASLMERWRIDRKKLSRYTAQEILELAVRGNVLIRGWGATYLLRSVPHAGLGICAAHAVDKRAIPSRNADRAFLYRGNTVSLAASGAQSGWPASNGGSGLYSRPSWIA